jgi:hypothetical protein
VQLTISRSSAGRSWLAVLCRFPGELGAPPPKAGDTEQRRQDRSQQRDSDRPANCQPRNYKKDGQQDYAGDYEDGGERHGLKVSSKQ